jgi:polyferredoxin
VIKYALTVAIFGGTVITIINQGETLALGGELSLGKALLTYITLYCLATYLALTTR